MQTEPHPLLNRAVLANPYPVYERLREAAAVHHLAAPLHAYLITRYEDVGPILRNHAHFSSRSMDFSQRMSTRLSEEARRMTRTDNTLLGADPPVHTRLRALVTRAFTPRRVAQLEPRVRALTRELLEPLLQQQEPELMGGLGAPLPCVVIAELLGVEPERREDFRRWAQDVVKASSLSLSSEEPERLEASIRALHAYMSQTIEERRRAPREDLISALLEAEQEQELLTPEELLHCCRLLLIAGQETTTHLLGNAFVALARHPAEWERLVAEPALVSQAVEEVLRYDAPVQGLLRESTQEVQVAGQVIPAGSRVMLLFGSAHHDPRRYARPERFDITRQEQGHYGFGHGIHFCLGAALARLEARVVLEEWLARVRRFELAPGQEESLDWGHSLFLRGPRSLRIRLERHP